MTIETTKMNNHNTLIESEIQVLATANLQKEVEEELKGDPSEDFSKAELLIEGEVEKPKRKKKKTNGE